MEPVWPQRFFIRDIEIAPAVVLAPMEDVTDIVFRRLIRSIGGAGLTCTEFVPSKGLVAGVKRDRAKICFDPDERPVSVQIFGRDPQLMADAARLVQDMGASICDINMGCPSKKVCAHSGGSALMRDPDLAVDIVRAVRAAITIPLTVKMRSGFDHKRRNAAELAWACQEEGAESIAIHWRTRADRYAGTRQVDRIAAAVQRCSVPVIANGDVIDPESARQMIRETGAAGVMVGRGAMRDPWSLLQIARAFRGDPPLHVDLQERRRVLEGYLDAFYARHQHEGFALGRMKKISKHFAEGLPDGKGFKMKLLRSQSLAEVRHHIADYFQSDRHAPIASAARA